jgi:hypothetical protein
MASGVGIASRPPVAPGFGYRAGQIVSSFPEDSGISTYPGVRISAYPGIRTNLATG